MAVHFLLVQLMYQLQLWMLCLLRKLMHQQQYPTLSIQFMDLSVRKFNHIVLLHKTKFIHVQIENVDSWCLKNDIDYGRLFGTTDKTFSLNSYLDSFVHLISGSHLSLKNIAYLVVYTNCGLDLTEQRELNKGRSRHFYPFKFDVLNLEECGLLRNFLFTNKRMEGRCFYQFSQDKVSREELLKRLVFSPAAQKVINRKGLSVAKVKEKFLRKLVFAVNQPNREELTRIIKRELRNCSRAEGDYSSLQERLLSNSTDLQQGRKLGVCLSGMLYEFSLKMLLLHDVFTQKSMLALNSVHRGRGNLCTYMMLSYRGRISCLIAHHADVDIGYSHLFPAKSSSQKLSVNRLFSVFVEGFEEEMRYIVVFTNVGLDLTIDDRMQRQKQSSSFPFKFDRIDVQKKRYKIFRDCSGVNEKDVYRFSPEESTRKELYELLGLPSSLQKEKEAGGLSDEQETEMKKKFVDRLIFAVDQPNRKSLNSIITNEIGVADVPYNYEELHEVTLRWCESRIFGSITEDLMKKILGDIKVKKSSYRQIQLLVRPTDEVIKFAKSVVLGINTPSFHHFMDFLLVGEGRVYLKVLENQGISLTTVSCILNGCCSNAAEDFKGLYNLWFDEEGNSSPYLKTIKENRINLRTMSSILKNSRSNAAKAFESLHDLWFDTEGNKTKYLKSLEENGIYLISVSGILNGAGTSGPKAFKDLHHLWFDEQGHPTQYLKSPKENGINLTTMSSILNGAGKEAEQTYKVLHDLWFNKEGKKTKYLKTLETNGICLTNMSTILSRAGIYADTAFLDLYNLWFDAKGNKTKYLEVLEKQGVNLVSMAALLNPSGSKAAGAFKELFDLWFDTKGGKTKYLNVLQIEGISMVNLVSILRNSGCHAARAFKNLYDLWFDKKEHKTRYLKKLEQEGINLVCICSILRDSRGNAAAIFQDLYRLWFNGNGKKSHYLRTFEKEGVNLSVLASMLNGAGSKVVKQFRDLYSLFFDKHGHKTPHLKHFTEKEEEKRCFTLHNLFVVLSKAGADVKCAFEQLHGVCYDDEGNETKLLDDFYKAGFEANNLSSMLCGAGSRASSNLMRLYEICFDNEGEKTRVLNDFCSVGFRLDDVCNLLCGAAGSLKKFHNFCFGRETRQYLDHFVQDKKGFTLSRLCRILSGAKSNVRLALTKFHNVCFEETGTKTQLLQDFCNVGFRPKYLAKVLSMAGRNASSIFIDFHEICFKGESKLKHFLAEKELFTPKTLSKLLVRGQLKICSNFEKLYSLCFGEEGNKTSYFVNLINNYLPNEVLDSLYEEGRKSYELEDCVLIDDDIMDDDIIVIEDIMYDDVIVIEEDTMDDDIIVIEEDIMDDDVIVIDEDMIDDGVITIDDVIDDGVIVIDDDVIGDVEVKVINDGPSNNEEMKLQRRRKRTLHNLSQTNSGAVKMSGLEKTDNIKRRRKDD